MGHSQNTDLSVFKNGSQHHHAAGLVPELVAHGTQGVYIGHTDFLYQCVHAFDFFHLVRRAGCRCCSHLTFQCFNFLAGVFRFRQQHVQTFLHIRITAVKFGCHIANGLFQAFHILQGAKTGHCFNTAHARTGGRLADDLEETDLGRVAYMYAAAQFHREIRNGNDPHHGAVFFTEQRHRASFLCFFNRHFFKGYGLGRQNLFVNHLLHLRQLFRRYLGEVGKVKMQTVRTYIAACLVDMASQHSAEGCLQQMGSRMVTGNVGSPDSIHFIGHCIPNRNSTLFHRTCHKRYTVRQLFRLGNTHHARRCFNHADIA